MLHVLLACDKFKGCLSSQHVNQSLAQGLALRAKTLGIPLNIHSYCVSDGGEGFLEMAAQDGRLYQQKSVLASTPQGIPIQVPWLFQAESGQAFVETAKVIGNGCISDTPLQPLNYTSQGVGEVLQQIAQYPGIQRIYLGLGSTATVDGGLGLLAALGAKYQTQKGLPLVARLHKLPQIQTLIPPTIALPPLTLIADVHNPWLGSRGGIQVYGPQKGLTTQQIIHLSRQMEDTWLPLLQHHGYHSANLSQHKHGGAAGGIGLALSAFYDTQWENGAAWCIQHLKLEQKMVHMQALISGEGCFDKSSWEGKITGNLIALGRTLNKRVFGVFGQVEPELNRPSFVQKSPYQGASHTLLADPEETKAWLKNTGQQLLDTFEQLF